MARNKQTAAPDATRYLTTYEKDTLANLAACGRWPVEGARCGMYMQDMSPGQRNSVPALLSCEFVVTHKFDAGEYVELTEAGKAVAPEHVSTIRVIYFR